jgi:hypothetical protein
MPNTNRYLATILTVAAILGAICTGVFATKFGFESGLSCGVGVLLGMANIYALAKLVTVMIDGEVAKKKRTRAAILLGAKFLGLVTIVGILVVNHWVRGGALMAGLTMVALSIVLGGLLRSSDESTPSRSSE